MKNLAKKVEGLLEIGGTKKDIVLLVLSGLALLISIFDLLPLPFDAAWAAIILCGVPIILEAIGNATRHGFLVREGDALERLATVSVIAFDKTGTLTYGTPEVAAVESLSGYSSGAIYEFAAAAEQYSEHPLGKAIVRCYKQSTGKPLPPAAGFQMLPGQGVSASVHGKAVLAGNQKMLLEKGIPCPGLDAVKAHLSKGRTVIYLAVDGALAGYTVLSDAVRVESAAMIESLHEAGVTPVLLTGDNENAASAISSALRIREVHANCLPEDKLKYIDAYEKQGTPVCMTGDGVNDAPALKKATVGIAMGGVGSDIAVDAADIALVDDEVKELPHLFSLSKHMMTTIKLNLTFSMTLNFIAIVLAMTGILNPVIGALVHNAGSVLVIINSALLLKWRKQK